jgi:hypothetical protein
MKVVLTNLSDKLYESSRKRLNDSARRFGIEKFNSFDFEDIKGTDFYVSNKIILDIAKGTGAWLWKPYIILESLKDLDEGDIVIYCDCGAEIIKELDPLLKICITQEPIVIFANGNLLNAEWTKRDSFILMNCDSKDYWYSLQCDASFGLFRKSDKTIHFLNEWMSYCTDERILTDSDNICGKNNLPGFIEHRWDQSILSLLAKRFEIPLFRMPSQFGNHYKSPEFRIKGEFNCVNQYKQKQLTYYSRKYYSNSLYYQLLDHHRMKNGSLLLNNGNINTLKIIVRIFKKQSRFISGITSKWYNKTFT